MSAGTRRKAVAPRSSGTAARLLLVNQLVIYGLRFGRLAVLARVLSPSDFGVFGLATVLISACTNLTALGPRVYLIQHENPTPETVATVWTVDALRGLAMTVVAIALAPLFANDASSSDVVAIQVAVLSIGLFALRSPGSVLAERSVAYRRVAAVELVGAVAGAVVTVGLGLAVQSVVALCLGLTLGTLAEIVASWVLFPQRVRPALDRAEMRGFIRAGSRLLVVSIGTFVMTQLDFFVIERVLGAAVLGVYLLAFRLGEIPSVVISNVGNRLATPLLSRASRKEGSDARAFEELFTAGAGLSIGSSIALIGLARPGVLAAFGDQYEDGITVVRVLSVAFLGRGLSQVVGAAMNARGEFGLAARFKFVEVFVFVVGLAVGIHFGGLAGAAAGVAAGYACALAMRLRWSCSRYEWTAIGLAARLWRCTWPFLPPLLVALALEQASLVVQGVTGGAAFAVVSLWWFVLRLEAPARRLLPQLG